MAEYFTGDTYSTPAGVPRALREYILLGTRWSPYSYFIETILKHRGMALEGKYDDEAWAKSSYDLIKNLEKCGARFEVKGLDVVRGLRGPAVFVSNHMGTLETTTLPGLICPIRPVTYVVKSKLVTGFFWGPIMRSRDPILVSRKDPRADLESVLTGGADRLAKGVSVIIFPQGTRADVFDRSRFNSLGIKLASRAGVPVVPVAVKTDFWTNGTVLRGFGPIKRDRTVHIEFGPAMSVEGRGKAEHQACVDFVESRLRAWGAPVLDRAAAAPDAAKAD